MQQKSRNAKKLVEQKETIKLQKKNFKDKYPTELLTHRVARKNGASAVTKAVCA